MGHGKVPLIVAAALAAGAALAAYYAVRKKEDEVRKDWVLVPVLVAGDALLEGAILGPETLLQRKMPERFVTRSVVKPENLKLIEGRRLLAPMQEGDPLLWTHVESGQRPGQLANLVRKGGRAFALEVSGAKVNVGGWLRPNDRVDILTSFTDPATNDFVAMTLLQNVVVLSTGRTSAAAAPGAKEDAAHRYESLNLLVTPEEAELLTVALGNGALTLTLRNPDDLEVEEDRGRANLATLITGERLRASERRRAKSVVVIRGVEVDR